MVGRAAWGCGVLCCVASLVAGRAVLVCSPPPGRACCVSVWAPHGGAVMRCDTLRCGVLCCVVLSCVMLCVVVVYGPTHGGACCVGVWPPSWWGVLRWSAVCCVVWRCVCWPFVASFMVGRAAWVRDPPHGWAWCVGVWTPSWWGVRCWLVFASCFWLWCCWCLARTGGPAPGARAVRHPFVLAGTDGPASRVLVSQVLLPCRSFSPCLLTCACAVFGRPLAGALFAPPPPPRSAWRVSWSHRCSSFLFNLAGFRCGPPTGSCCRQWCTPRSGSAFLVACLLLLVFGCSRFVLPLLPPLPHPSWFVLLGCCRPTARFSLCARCLLAAAPRLVCRRASALVVAPLARPPPPPGCVPRLALLCPLCSLCLLFSSHPSAVCLCLVLPPPTFVLVSLARASSPLLLCVSACCFGRSGVRCTLRCCAVCCCPSCLVRCRLVLLLVCRVLRGAPRCCVVRRRLMWRRVCCFAVLLCSLLCVWAWCLVALCVVRVVSCCAVLSCFSVCCAVLRLLALCCAALRLVVPRLAVLLCTGLSVWCRVGFSSSFGRCSVLCCSLCCCVFCCVLCCPVLRCCVLCCVSDCGVLVRCAVLFALCFAVVSGPGFPCAMLCLLALSCAALRLVVPCRAVLLCTVLSAWRCVAFSHAFGCCFVLCPAFGCCMVLWGAVRFGASLGYVALCCVRCAVVLRAPLWCRAGCAESSVHFRKQKNCFLCIFKDRKIVSRRCLALCTLSSLHATIPQIEKAGLLYLLNS